MNHDTLAYICAAFILAFTAFVLRQMWSGMDESRTWRDFENKVLRPLSPDEYAAETPEERARREYDWALYKKVTAKK